MDELELMGRGDKLCIPPYEDSGDGGGDRRIPGRDDEDAHFLTVSTELTDSAA